MESWETFKTYIESAPTWAVNLAAFVALLLAVLK